ncbi:uncharacterized protein [Vulpes vulpes]|uniref:Uncharacterized protein isoform X2 n=1 Tax=Vulpes vulpes TaxID=9627 RepID=A0ABM4ZH63_VULVU
MDLQQRNPAIHQGQTGPGPLPQEAQRNLQNFLKGQPVIIGVSQIMIGLMNICLWIMVKVFLSFHKLHLFLEDTVYTFIFLLGPTFIYGSIGTNTVAAILTGVSLIIVAFRIAISLYFLPSTSIRYFMIGIMSMKLILIILGLILSVLLSAFGCSAVCCGTTSVVVDLSSNECELPISALYHNYDDVAFQPT